MRVSKHDGGDGMSSDVQKHLLHSKPASHDATPYITIVNEYRLDQRASTVHDLKAVQVHQLSSSDIPSEAA